MFDIGFTEILVIAVVALFVIGPERLPQTVRDISLWIGRLKRSLRDTRQELEQQIGADEIRRTLHNENVLQKLHHIKKDVEDTLNEDLMNEEEDYELPPHDSNNDIDDDEDIAQNSEGTAKNTPKPVPPPVTAEALMSGEMPFATAAESASNVPSELEQEDTSLEKLEAEPSDEFIDKDVAENLSDAEEKAAENSQDSGVKTAASESAENSISGKSSSNHANSQFTASN